MPRTTNPSILARRPLGGVRGAGWFARWLLVLVVALDLLSAPFHHHLHDGGQGQREFATAHASLEASASDTHMESDDHLLVSHATMAIRINPSRLAQLPPIDNAAAQLALVSVLHRLAAVDDLPPPQWRPDRSRPDFRSHRSLPPPGRAPPIHA